MCDLIGKCENIYVLSIGFQTMKCRMNDEKSHGQDDEYYSDNRLYTTTTH